MFHIPLRVPCQHAQLVLRPGVPKILNFERSLAVHEILLDGGLAAPRLSHHHVKVTDVLTRCHVPGRLPTLVLLVAGKKKYSVQDPKLCVYIISSRVYTYYSMFRYFTSGVMSNSGYSFTSLSPHPIKSSVTPDNGLFARKCGLSQLTFDHSSGISVWVASHLFKGLTWQSQCNEFPERYSHGYDSFFFFGKIFFSFLKKYIKMSYRDTVLSSRCL